MRNNVDAKCLQQRFGHCASRNPCRSFASTGTLKNITSISKTVLLHPGEVSVTRTNLSQWLFSRPRRGVHLLVPLVATEPFGVLDLDRHRRTQCPPVTDPTDQSKFVDLELLTRTSPITQPTTAHLSLYLLNCYLQPSWQSFHHYDKASTMRFARREIPQHQSETTGSEVRLPQQFSSRLRQVENRASVPAVEPPDGSAFPTHQWSVLLVRQLC